jgi:hypothetical protein
MATRSELRKEAYRYVLQVLSNLPAEAGNDNWIHFIPLEELRLLKEGIADPSPALVSLLKEMLQSSITDNAINARLVTPFEQYDPD